MAFKIPRIPTNKIKQQDELLQQFDMDEVTKIKKLGSGAFATAYLASYKKEDVVLKELHFKQWESDGRKFLKEARILYELPSHENITPVRGVCYNPFTIMLQYCCFSFSPFTDDAGISVNSLDNFLKFIDNFDSTGFEPIVEKCGKDISMGLSFLHKHKIAHRDLKPSNVLVCNRHYSSIADSKSLQTAIEQVPIVCKLADFGESRSALNQTKTLLSTKTDNTDRGTIPFLAPEILPGGSLHSANQEDLMKIDVWALGMTLFCLLNPDLPYPFIIEKPKQCSLSSFEIFMGEKLNGDLVLPKMSDKYFKSRWIHWGKLYRMYLNVADISYDNRPLLTSDFVMEIFDRSVSIIHLNVSQETALVNYSDQVARGKSVSHPTNDGTNSCVFLCYKIASHFASHPSKGPEDELHIKNVVEHIILEYPTVINSFRDIDRPYDVTEVKNILAHIDMSIPNGQLMEHLSSLTTTFSTAGERDLSIALEKLAECNYATAIYTCPPL